MADVFSTWFRSFRPATAARLRMVCLPHAGGSARFFRDWADDLPDDVELLAVQYPGREDRLEDDQAGDLCRLADRIVAALEPALDRPIALFGHSLGAAIAYEMARRIEQRDSGADLTLIVSGRPGPRRERGGVQHLLDDDGLCTELIRLGGTNALVFEHPELLRLVLPAVREDYRLSETYRPNVEILLSCPVVACRGADDPEVTAAESHAWHEVTRGEFTSWVYRGSHFFLVDRHAELLERIVCHLNTRRGPCAPSGTSLTKPP
jgi:pyochelin biosynthetic protein PchC